MKNEIERVFLLIVIAAIIGTGLVAGVAGIFVGGHDSWSPRDYVARPGDCFVAPQGDPLYDAHYAENVNVPNCNAFKTQSEARFVDAQTDKVRTETGVNTFGVYGIFGIVGIILVVSIFGRRSNG